MRFRNKKANDSRSGSKTYKATPIAVFVQQFKFQNASNVRG